MSLIKDLYEGRVLPFDQILPQDGEYRALMREIGEEREYFRNRLPKEDQERFDKWNELQVRSLAMDLYAHFEYGFKLGANLMNEIKGTEGIPLQNEFGDDD